MFCVGVVQLQRVAAGRPCRDRATRAAEAPKPPEHGARLRQSRRPWRYRQRRGCEPRPDIDRGEEGVDELVAEVLGRGI